MKLFSKILFFVAGILSITSCEKYWSKYDEELLEMNVNIIAEADSTISGYVMPVLNSMNDKTHLFFESNRSDASVTAAIEGQYSINNGEKHRILKGNSSYFYMKPGLKAGDKLSIDLTGYYFKPASASVTIPDKPQMEVEYMGNISDKNNTYMRLKIKIKDNAEKDNYYMLDVYTSTTRYIEVFYDNKKDSVIQYRQDSVHSYAFISQDNIFEDDQVKNRINGMAENFSNIFSDRLFNGQEYEFIVECPINLDFEYWPTYYNVTDIKNYVSISISEFSKEYYDYCKTWEYTDENAKICYTSNIDGGIGVFGAINRTKPVRFDFKK